MSNFHSVQWEPFGVAKQQETRKEEKWYQRFFQIDGMVRFTEENANLSMPLASMLLDIAQFEANIFCHYFFYNLKGLR